MTAAIGGLLIVLLIGILAIKAADVALTARERSENPAPGELVEVNGDRMHVASFGEGATTIVLIPGLGTSSPVSDFQPLTDRLAEWARVVVVEPFGYGWSDATDRPMTVEHVARDIRSALDGAQIAGPYVLMAHSLGGLYAQQFAQLFPFDTATIVGIDPTLARGLDFAPNVPADVDPYASPIPPFFGWAADLGLTRIVQAFVGDDPQLTTGASAANGYSSDELALQRTMTNWNGMSRNVRDQAERLGESMEVMRDSRFLPDQPVLVFLASTEGTVDDWLADAAADHLTGSACAETVVVRGGHYLHHTAAATLSEAVREFVSRGCAE